MSCICSSYVLHTVCIASVKFSDHMGEDGVEFPPVVEPIHGSRIIIGDDDSWYRSNASLSSVLISGDDFVVTSNKSLSEVFLDIVPVPVVEDGVIGMVVPVVQPPSSFEVNMVCGERTHILGFAQSGISVDHQTEWPRKKSVMGHPVLNDWEGNE